MDSQDKYIVLEDDDGSKIIIDKQKALKIDNELLQRYSIKSTKSDDLQ
jgi:non-homologous end joining protein Ku